MITAMVLLNLAGGDCVEDPRYWKETRDFVEFSEKWRTDKVRLY